MSAFRFSEIARSGAARSGLFTTPHGDVETPAFMPVGTQGAVRAVTPEQVRRTGARVVLASHLGRPKGQRKPDLSLEVVAEPLRRALERLVQHGGRAVVEGVRDARGERRGSPTACCAGCATSPP